MSFVDEREKGFERKFANDEAREFRARARRNRMLGEWAAGLMGLASLDDYAAAIVKYDLEQKGGEVVLRKVTQDLAGAGVSVREGEVLAKMDEFLAIARGQIQAGG